MPIAQPFEALPLMVGEAVSHRKPQHPKTTAHYGSMLASCRAIEQVLEVLETSSRSAVNSKHSSGLSSLAQRASTSSPARLASDFAFCARPCTERTLAFNEEHHLAVA
jgi:hypothetical protein